MVLSNILHSGFTLTDVENNIKLNDLTKGRQESVTNQLRRSGFGKNDLK
jgi:hypothetical protein